MSHVIIQFIMNKIKFSYIKVNTNEALGNMSVNVKYFLHLESRTNITKLWIVTCCKCGTVRVVGYVVQLLQIKMD